MSNALRKPITDTAPHEALPAQTAYQMFCTVRPSSTSVPLDGIGFVRGPRPIRDVWSDKMQGVALRTVHAQPFPIVFGNKERKKKRKEKSERKQYKPSGRKYVPAAACLGEQDTLLGARHGSPKTLRRGKCVEGYPRTCKTHVRQQPLARAAAAQRRDGRSRAQLLHTSTFASSQPASQTLIRRRLAPPTRAQPFPGAAAHLHRAPGLGAGALRTRVAGARRARAADQRKR